MYVKKASAQYCILIHSIAPSVDCWVKKCSIEFYWFLCSPPVEKWAFFTHYLFGGYYFMNIHGLETSNNNQIIKWKSANSTQLWHQQSMNHHHNDLQSVYPFYKNNIKCLFWHRRSLLLPKLCTLCQILYKWQRVFKWSLFVGQCFICDKSLMGLVLSIRSVLSFFIVSWL